MHQEIMTDILKIISDNLTELSEIGKLLKERIENLENIINIVLPDIHLNFENRIRKLEEWKSFKEEYAIQSNPHSNLSRNPCVRCGLDTDKFFYDVVMCEKCSYLFKKKNNVDK